MTNSANGIGIDIGGTRIKAVCIDADGSILEKRIVPTVDDAAALIRVVTDLRFTLCGSEAPMAISAPGIASRDNRSISWMRGRMQSVEGLDWSDQLNRKVWVLNDAHAATLSEAWLGSARNVENVVMLTLGTGVGGGVILNGKLFQGTSGRAGHLGHITLDQGAPLDIVGMPGSLEDCIGNHNLYARSGSRFYSTAEMLAAMAAGDAQARECWEASVRGLAIGIASLINCFDPDLVVLGGGIAECETTLFDSLRVYLDQFEWRPTGIGVPIVKAQLGELAGAIGAARFAALKNSEN